MKTPQTLGIEYEIVDLEGDLDGDPTGPASPRRLIPEDIAFLSGGLFDGVPKVEVPLDSFFPPPAPDLRVEDLRPPRMPRVDSLYPVSLSARSDSLLPIEADAAPAPEPHSAGRAAAIRWSGMVTAAAVGMIATTLFLRSGARPAAPPPVAPASPAAAAPAAPKAESTLAKPTAPATTTKLAAPAKPARPAAPAPARDEATPAPQPTTEIAPSAPPPVDPLHQPEIAPQGVPPQRAAVAIAAAARGAASCLDADDLRRTMAVSVTFAPSGRATRATVEGGPHRGTAAGSCIAQRLRSAAVSPFEGPAVTIRTSISVR